jgi:hypothetical protein
MFGLLKKSSQGVVVADKVWKSHAAKMAACKEMIAINPHVLLVVWFPESLSAMLSELMLPGDQRNVILAKDLHAQTTHGRMIVFAEHYPIPDTEQHLFKQLELKDVPVLSSLDEPLFSYFGGERLIATMEKLGMHEHEVIAHSFVTGAIAKAQRKIGEKVKIENRADSQQDWFRKNLGGRDK